MTPTELGDGVRVEAAAVLIIWRSANLRAPSPPPRWLAPLIEKLDKRKHPGKWRPRRKQAHVAKRAKRASARLNLEFEELPLADQVIITLLRVSYPADDFFDVPIKILMRKIEPDWRAACEKPGLKFRELNRHAVRRALKSARKLLR